MTHSYSQSSFGSGDSQFESAKNQETEQMRTLEGLPTFYNFVAGVTTANQVLEWKFATGITIESFWVYYASTPSGTLTCQVYNSEGTLLRTLTFNTANNGEKFDNAWAYKFNSVFALDKGYKVRFSSSVNINGVSAYGRPCVIFDAFEGLRVS